MAGGRQIAIVGAGIGGLGAAIALASAGFAVDVFEREPSLKDGGGALILWCNALKALERIGVREALLGAPTAQVVETSEFRRHDGEFLTNLPVRELGERHASETIVVSRRDLLATLHDGARERGARVEFGAGLVEMRDEGGAVHAEFEGARTGRFDALIGADGIMSTVRDKLGIDSALRRTNQDLWVGTARAGLDGIERGVTIASVGGGRRFWHTLLGDGRAFWYAAVPTVGAGAPPTTIEELARGYSAWHDPIPALLRATSPDDATRTPMRDRRPELPWGRQRITLLGDSAHAMTPDLGQGACQALESAAVLGAELAAGRADIESALRSYERERHARTSDVTRMSWVVAQTSAVADPTLSRVRDAAMRIGLRAAVMSQLDWLFAGP